MPNSWKKLPTFDIPSVITGGMLISREIHLTKLEVDFLTSLLTPLCEVKGKNAGATHRFYMRDNEELPIGDSIYWDDFAPSLITKLMGGSMNNQVIRAMDETKAIGGVGLEALCCEDVAASIDDPFITDDVTDLLEVRDVRCLRISAFVDFLIKFTTKMVEFHTAIVGGMPESIATLGLVGGITALSALILTGGTIIVPAVVIIGATTLLVYQYGMSYVQLSTLWGQTNLYLIANRCDLINLLWNSRSGDQAKEATLDFLENIWQSQGLASAIQSPLVRRVAALALPNKLFNNLFNFLGDMTIANTQCDCPECYPANNSNENTWTAVFQLDVLDPTVTIPPLAQWPKNVVFEAQWIEASQHYRMDICNPLTNEGGDVVGFQDLSTDIRAIYDGYLNTEGLSGYPIAIDFEADVIEDYGVDWVPIDKYCLFRQGWTCRIISMSSSVNFRAKLATGIG